MRSRFLVAGAALALVIGLSASGTARAVELTLADLIDGGGSFSSDNGDIEFSMFEAQVEGLPSFLEEELLEHTLVKSVEHGFKIWSPVISAAGFDVSLHVDYKAMAGPGLNIDGAKITFLGFEFAIPGLGTAESKGIAKFFDPSDDALLAMLMADGTGHPEMDAAGFDPIMMLDGTSWLVANTHGKALAKALDLKHEFRTVPKVPEPAAGAMLLLGCVGLWRAGRSDSN